MLIMCKGRLHNSSLLYGAKHPVLIPKHHWFTRLVIRYAHTVTLHGGVSETLMTIKRSFWIPRTRHIIKSCIKECTTCLRYDLRSIKYPGPPPIPSERVHESRPFHVVVDDYTGSIILQNPNSRLGEQRSKILCK